MYFSESLNHKTEFIISRKRKLYFTINLLSWVEIQTRSKFGEGSPRCTQKPVNGGGV